MTHMCKAGCQKLVVMYDGRIIPCEAFKGLIDEYPQLVLGNIHEGTTLKEASERVKDIPLLNCFRDEEMDPTTFALVSVMSHLHAAIKVLDQHKEEHPSMAWMERLRQHLKDLHKHVVLCCLENEDMRVKNYHKVNARIE